MRRNEDDRNPATLGIQPRLQIETRHSRHAYIRDQACSLVLFTRAEEFLGRRKATCRQPNSLQQVLHCAAHRIIVIDNDDQLGRSEEHTSELQSHSDLVCRLLLEKKNRAAAASPFRTVERLSDAAAVFT